EVRRRRAPGVCAAPTAGGRYQGHVNARLGSDHMKTFWAVSVALLISIVIVGPLAARDLKDKVHVEVDNTVMEPGMAPGTYVCSGGHLHVKGTVQNQADVPLRHVKGGGKAFDANGNRLGTATRARAAEKPAP